MVRAEDRDIRTKKRASRQIIVELISDAPHSENITWSSRVFFDLCSEPVYVRVNISLVTFVGGVPDRAEEIVPCVDVSRGGGKKLENIEFDWCKKYLFSAELYLVPGEVNFKVAVSD